MKRKSIGWVALPACLVAVSIAVIGGRATTPRSARAASSKSRANFVSPETTQACQDIIDQMIAMQRTAMDKKRSGAVKPLTADDQLVAQEYQLDMSKCPADFQLALFRFMMTEDTARLHAHMDRTGKAERILGVVVEGVTPQYFAAGKSVQSLIRYNEELTDQQKRDLANMQAALKDVAQVATKYGVK
jgi:hypothetical protein